MNPRDRSGATIDDDDGGERQKEGDGVSTVSLPEDSPTKQEKCFDETSGAVYYYNDATVRCRFSSVSILIPAQV